MSRDISVLLFFHVFSPVLTLLMKVLMPHEKETVPSRAKFPGFCSRTQMPMPAFPFNYSAFTSEVSSENGTAPPPTIVKPCNISLPLTYIIYDGRTSQAPLQNISRVS